MKAQVPDLTSNTLERRLVELESWVSRIRAERLVLLREIDLRQVPLADGCRSLAERTAGRLDATRETAKQLVAASTTLQDQPDFRSDLDQGLVSFDRAHQTARLAAAGASNERLAHARGLVIAGLRRLTASLRRMTRTGERELLESRFLVLQPNLDSSSYRLWGRLPGTDGETVYQALATRPDSFPTLPDGARPNRGQRHADALVFIATDSLAPHLVDQPINRHKLGRGGEQTGRHPLLTRAADVDRATVIDDFEWTQSPDPHVTTTHRQPTSRGPGLDPGRLDQLWIALLKPTCEERRPSCSNNG